MLPTPTPFPDVVATPAININAGDWRIWNYTDEAVQIWNRMGDGATVIQIAVIIVIVISFVAYLAMAIQSLKDE